MIFVAFKHMHVCHLSIDSNGIEITLAKKDEIDLFTHQCVLPQIEELKPGKYTWEQLAIPRDVIEKMSLTIQELRELFEVSTPDACSACGSVCCTSEAGYPNGEIVDLNPLECKDLSNVLTVKPQELAQPYHTSYILDGEVRVITLSEDKCIAFIEGKCSIYPIRPLGCRQFTCLTSGSIPSCVNLSEEDFNRYREQYAVEVPDIHDAARMRGLDFSELKSQALVNYCGEIIEEDEEEV